MCFTASLRERSDPETRYPWRMSSSAIPLMPMPPTPIKWMRLIFLYILPASCACGAAPPVSHSQSDSRANRLRGEIPLDPVADGNKGIRTGQSGSTFVHRRQCVRLEDLENGCPE